jgi:LEA14-like dessication related protein
MRIHSAGRTWYAAVALVGTVALGGCASLKAPTLQVDGIKMRDMGITGASLDITFRVRNPNPEKLTVDKLEYELSLNGQRLGRGYEAHGFELEGFAEEKITSQFDVNMLTLPLAVKNTIEDKDGEASVKGHFYVREGASGSLRKLGFKAKADLTFGR